MAIAIQAVAKYAAVSDLFGREAYEKTDLCNSKIQTVDISLHIAKRVCYNFLTTEQQRKAPQAPAL